MANLVIHPKDHTTDFLIEGYRQTDFNVLNTTCSKSALKRLIFDHKRIIMMGHGGDIGLIGFKRMVIDSTFVFALRTKKESVYIWCNADLFVKKYNLTGFATGMIISELEESYNYGVPASLEQIAASNVLFADCISKTINLSVQDMHKGMKELYVLEGNPVVEFNRQNLFLFE